MLGVESEAPREAYEDYVRSEYASHKPCRTVPIMHRASELIASRSSDHSCSRILKLRRLWNREVSSAKATQWEEWNVRQAGEDGEKRT